MKKEVLERMRIEREKVAKEVIILCWKHLIRRLRDKSVTKEEKLGILGALFGKLSEYPKEWNNTLREMVRQRDNHTCQICKKAQKNKRHAVHHIDYNKEHCEPTNLITLCPSCHTKTNHNRESWKEYFYARQAS